MTQERNNIPTLLEHIVRPPTPRPLQPQQPPPQFPIYQTYQTPTSWDTPTFLPYLSQSGYCVICSNKDFGVLGDFGDLRDLGILGKQRLHKSTQLGIKQGLVMWPQVMIGEGNSDQVDYAREGLFREFGKPHAFTSEVYQRPVFIKRTSLRLVLWS